MVSFEFATAGCILFGPGRVADVPAQVASLGVTRVLLVIGAVLLLSERVPFLAWLGRLPGDLVFRRGNTTIFVPIVTSIVLSVILTLVLSLLFRRQ